VQGKGLKGRISGTQYTGLAAGTRAIGIRVVLNRAQPSREP